MSRAFVKESDEDSASDLPELPVSEHANYVTARGQAQLRTRLAEAEQRLEAIDDNAVGAKLERATIERDMRWLQTRLLVAILVDIESPPRDRVAFGASVEVVDDDDRHYRYRIVGEDEADPEQGLVSWVSPLARALNGAQVGDSVIWKRPAGDLAIEVLAIDYPTDP